MSAQRGATNPAQAQGNSLYQQLEDYDWDNDPEFQGGLTAILGKGPDLERTQELTLRARCFYYSRKYGIAVDFDAYKSWREQNLPKMSNYASMPPSVNLASTSSDPSAPYPNSFEHIVELIASGQSIPGIRDIPDTVLEGEETQSTAVRRKKPWEKGESSASIA
ncbi:MAG: hypothetical protein M1819_005138 [Sarea resinae]|nr:MAG: hypothetical protein M1819_005138 [Sarea resinae]